ncbi:hypothetical protein [Streptomyces sp. NPDC057877]|uniref:hypothetical protein n=1 Tax=Streptomyces sp. NPDC057877 TaxID=3346269 RepID=UPI0036918F71
MALAVAAVAVSGGTAHGEARWSAADLAGVGSALLYGVTRVDDDSTWAYGVGVSGEGKVRPTTPLLLARDGDAGGWRQVPMQGFAGSGSTNRINSLDAVGEDDAWAVGDHEGQRGAIHTQHWDGSTWRVVEAPVPEDVVINDAGLLDVSARAGDDVWAVGWITVVDSEVPHADVPGGVIQETHNEAVVQHWDGEAWRLVRVPGASSLMVNSVAAVADDDVWVSGYTAEDQPAMLHYDGRSWSRVAVPYDGVNGELIDLEARGAGDVWAAGRKLDDDEDRGHALVAHWNGRAWQQVSAPASAGRVKDLALAPGGVTVAGEQADGRPYVMRLRDGRWSDLGVPEGGAAGSRYLAGLTWTSRGVTVAANDWGAAGLTSPVLLTGGR